MPMTYLGRDGKQYVVVAAGGTNRFRMIANTADKNADTLIAFALPILHDSGVVATKSILAAGGQWKQTEHYSIIRRSQQMLPQRLCRKGREGQSSSRYAQNATGQRASRRFA